MSILILFAALYNSWYVVLLQLYTPVSLLAGITVYILADSFVVYFQLSTKDVTNVLQCLLGLIIYPRLMLKQLRPVCVCPNTEKYKGAI